MSTIPDDVLERTYRRAVEQADALGITLADLLPNLAPSTADALYEYVARVYDTDPAHIPSWNANEQDRVRRAKAQGGAA